MRRVLIGDLISAARAICAVPPSDQIRSIERLLEQADAADAYRRKFAKPHARWGNGSLMSAALLTRSCAETSVDDPQFLRALAQICDALATRHAVHNR